MIITRYDCVTALQNSSFLLYPLYTTTQLTATAHNAYMKNINMVFPLIIYLLIEIGLCTYNITAICCQWWWNAARSWFIRHSVNSVMTSCPIKILPMTMTFGIQHHTVSCSFTQQNIQPLPLCFTNTVSHYWLLNWFNKLTVCSCITAACKHASWNFKHCSLQICLHMAYCLCLDLCIK